MKKINFNKMQGAGNDFVVIDNRQYGLDLESIIEITPHICDRKYGVGADGLLVLTEANHKGADYTMIYRNADGSDAGMCGNGARCLANFAASNGFDKSHTFNVHDNLYRAVVQQNNMVSIHFPIEIKPGIITVEGSFFVKADTATEHLVEFVEEEFLTKEDKLIQKGRRVRMHESLNPPGTNVNFVHIEDSNKIHLQTYERGVEGLTLACGTGAMASAVSSHFRQEQTESHAEYLVYVKGGELQVEFDFEAETETYKNLILKGPANFVFEGSITI